MKNPTSMRNVIRTVATLGLGAVLASTLVACGGGGDASSRTYGYKSIRTPEHQREARRVVLDGRMNEWGRKATVLADRDYVYFRVSVGERLTNLQSSPTTVALVIDADANPETGYRADNPEEANTLGTDLEIQFSPLDADAGRTRGGAIIYAIGSDGSYDELSHADADLSFLPTHAAEWYEVRLSRALLNAKLVPKKGLRSIGTMSAMFVEWDAAGNAIGWSDPVTLELPPARGFRKLANISIPANDPSFLRVMSYNVLRAAPETNSERFSRIFTAINPDVVLLQEWDGGTNESLAAWFSTFVDPSVQWHAVANAEQGVAVVSRYPIDSLGPARIEAAGRAVRAAAGIIQTPHGSLAAASLHLKCCGSVGSSEDARRVAEATAVKQQLGSAMDRSDATMRIIGGDLNLVGTREPLDILIEGLDADTSDLTIAEPTLLGDTSSTTWFDPLSAYTASRLDFQLFSDASLDIVRMFVLDTRRLSDKALAESGLYRTDSDGSDHLPVVVDVSAK